jgi:hypothetical protein
MIRVLLVARRGAMKARIQAGAQLDALIVTAPEPVRATAAQAHIQAADPRVRRASPWPG